MRVTIAEHPDPVQHPLWKSPPRVAISYILTITWWVLLCIKGYLLNQAIKYPLLKLVTFGTSDDAIWDSDIVWDTLNSCHFPL